MCPVQVLGQHPARPAPLPEPQGVGRDPTLLWLHGEVGSFHLPVAPLLPAVMKRVALCPKENGNLIFFPLHFAHRGQRSAAPPVPPALVMLRFLCVCTAAPVTLTPVGSGGAVPASPSVCGVTGAMAGHRWLTCAMERSPVPAPLCGHRVTGLGLVAL